MTFVEIATIIGGQFKEGQQGSRKWAEISGAEILNWGKLHSIYVMGKNKKAVREALASILSGVTLVINPHDPKTRWEVTLPETISTKV